MARQKQYIDTNVYDEAKKRIHHIYDIFDTIAIMFSGGKDSLAVLHLVKEVADERGLKKPINVVFRDEELIPMEVINFVNEYRNKDWVNMLWFTVPLASTKYIMSVCHNYIQWDNNREWVRNKPPWGISLEEGDPRVFDQYTMDAYTSKHYKGKQAFITGIRASESLMRFRASVSKLNDNYINAVTDKNAKNVNLCKPIYDWMEDDVFRYFYDRGIDYCKVYDHQMWGKGALRVSTPLHAETAKRFDNIKNITPELYAQVIRIFPEMLHHERYYRELNTKAIKEKYSGSFESIRSWITENITDSKQIKMAMKQLNTCIMAHRKRPNLYPLDYILNYFMSGAFKRAILPMAQKKEKVNEESN